MTLTEYLATIYLCLAESLAAESAWPDWLCLPGQQWPLWEPVTALASQQQWPKLGYGASVMAEVPAASRTKRQAAYETLFRGKDRPPLALYESQYVDGRLLGPTTFALKAIYQQVGMEVEGAELPDHAAVELAFLSFLVERQAEDPDEWPQWRDARRLFIKHHIGHWLPQVGHQLAAAADPAWSAIGLLLTTTLSPRTTHPPKQAIKSTLPQIADTNLCSLCGFCAQVCPTHALQIGENASTTRLSLQASLCVHCGQCERVCEARALTLMGGETGVATHVLYQSPRAICPGCGVAMVSEAELAAVVERLGHNPVWLDYCQACRGIIRMGILN